MKTFNVHAGHNPDGKAACGAVGLLKESTENRTIKDKVISYLKNEGHTVYDCTCNDGTDKNDVLKKIVSKCNAHTVDLDVSIHFNSGASDTDGNSKTTGTEVYVYSATSKACDEAKRIAKNIAALGFKNRGVKVNEKLYVLNQTKAPALLIEVCFVDDKDDVTLYQKNIDNVAKAIAEGILDTTITVTKTTETKTTAAASANTSSTFKSYKVKINTAILNVRAGAGTNYKITTTVKRNDVYTIIGETKNGSTTWGKLKSGAGYICLTYTKKL